MIDRVLAIGLAVSVEGDRQQFDRPAEERDINLCVRLDDDHYSDATDDDDDVPDDREGPW